VDYEHATLKAQESGDPAPASGWLKPTGFQYIDGVGLCSTLFEWTDKAKGYIEAKNINTFCLFSSTTKLVKS
jgi:phage I-like protein